VHGSRIRSLEGPPTRPFETRPFETIDAGPFVSDTGELTWSAIGGEAVGGENARQGRVIVDTPRSLALIGHTAPPLRHDRIEVRVDNPFCAIVFASLDGRPIATSDRLLLTAAARVANTGMTWNDTRSALANWGGWPTLIEPVTGTLVLRQLDDAVSVRVTALDGAGRALGEPMPAAKSRDGWTITLGKPATTWYVVTVGRARSLTTTGRR
jgi:hypothetical protein